MAHRVQRIQRAQPQIPRSGCLCDKAAGAPGVAGVPEIGVLLRTETPASGDAGIDLHGNHLVSSGFSVDCTPSVYHFVY